MRKYKPVEFQFDPKIKRITRRLRKEYRGLKSVAGVVNLETMGDSNPQERMGSANAQRVQEGQNGQGQQDNNNIIYMDDDRDRVIRDYAMLTP